MLVYDTEPMLLQFLPSENNVLMKSIHLISIILRIYVI
ncbi:hypothetical protein Pint_20828 [Pistacia integerrima]|uniref:Uncharacterized protein n=1 Tax=Pistacia integerrima TaxID=434235 RepID=A0ACC0XBS1_9ROSI|nr:hypothetical protein Pint_20828 [Pistacia integerrima]